MNRTKLASLLFIGFIALGASQANATLSLGSQVTQASAPAGVVALRATQGDWTTEDVPQTLQGVTATAYINTAGVVFAVSWTGPYKPDLKALLGPFFPQMTASIGGTSTASTADFVIVSTGHMRHFQGYALLKSQMPADFNLNAQ
jgi:hypothetical protein